MLKKLDQFIWPLVIILISQFITTGSVQMNLDAFIVLWLIIVGTTALIKAISPNYKIYLGMSTTPYLILSLISWQKQRSLGNPLFPWDLYSFDETLKILVIIVNSIPISQIIIIGAALLVGVWTIYKTPNAPVQLSKNQRIGYGVSSLSVAAILILANNPIHDYLFYNYFAFSIKDKSYQQMYHNKGQIISLIALKERGSLILPNQYDPKMAEEVLKTMQLQKIKIKNKNIKADVIVIMSESLFDPLQLTKLKWKEDPLKFTRQLMNNNLNNTIVPTYGGKTANSEFEFLTGFSLDLFSPGAVPYNIIFKDEKFPSSIVQAFKNSNYKTTAIHPGRKDFWNRENVYNNLGFDKFISEDEFVGANKLGNFIEDRAILSKLDEALPEPNNLDAPGTFNFIVTIQNHMPYNSDNLNYLDQDQLFESNTLNKAERESLNYYSHLLQNTDQFHLELVQKLKNRKRPVVLIIFGDHLPPLSANFSTLVKGGLIDSPDKSKWNSQDYQKVYSTPLVYWTNFGNEGPKNKISTSMLGINLINLLQLKPDSYQAYVETVLSNGETVPNEMINGSFKERSMYESIQYGILTHELKEERAPKGSL